MERKASEEAAWAAGAAAEANYEEEKWAAAEEVGVVHRWQTAWGSVSQ